MLTQCPVPGLLSDASVSFSVLNTSLIDGLFFKRFLGIIDGLPIISISILYDYALLL